MKPFLISALALALTMGGAFAGSDDAAAERVIARWDIDGDGAVARPEFIRQRADRFFRFDADDDGELNMAELQAMDAARETQRGDQRAAFELARHADMDKNQNRRVSKFEYMAHGEAVFAMLDRDADKAITPADFARDG